MWAESVNESGLGMKEHPEVETGDERDIIYPGTKHGGPAGGETQSEVSMKDDDQAASSASDIDVGDGAIDILEKHRNGNSYEMMESRRGGYGSYYELSTVLAETQQRNVQLESQAIELMDQNEYYTAVIANREEQFHMKELEWLVVKREYEESSRMFAEKNKMFELQEQELEQMALRCNTLAENVSFAVEMKEKYRRTLEEFITTAEAKFSAFAKAYEDTVAVLASNWDASKLDAKLEQIGLVDTEIGKFASSAARRSLAVADGDPNHTAEDGNTSCRTSTLMPETPKLFDVNDGTNLSDTSKSVSSQTTGNATETSRNEGSPTDEESFKNNKMLDAVGVKIASTVEGNLTSRKSDAVMRQSEGGRGSEQNGKNINTVLTADELVNKGWRESKSKQSAKSYITKERSRQDSRVDLPRLAGEDISSRIPQQLRRLESGTLALKDVNEGGVCTPKLTADSHLPELPELPKRSKTSKIVSSINIDMLCEDYRTFKGVSEMSNTKSVQSKRESLPSLELRGTRDSMVPPASYNAYGVTSSFLVDSQKKKTKSVAFQATTEEIKQETEDGSSMGASMTESVQSENRDRGSSMRERGRSKKVSGIGGVNGVQKDVEKADEVKVDMVAPQKRQPTSSTSVGKFASELNDGKKLVPTKGGVNGVRKSVTVSVKTSRRTSKSPSDKNDKVMAVPRGIALPTGDDKMRTTVKVIRSIKVSPAAQAAMAKTSSAFINPEGGSMQVPKSVMLQTKQQALTLLARAQNGILSPANIRLKEGQAFINRAQESAYSMIKGGIAKTRLLARGHAPFMFIQNLLTDETVSHRSESQNSNSSITSTPTGKPPPSGRTVDVHNTAESRVGPSEASGDGRATQLKPVEGLLFPPVAFPTHPYSPPINFQQAFDTWRQMENLTTAKRLPLHNRRKAYNGSFAPEVTNTQSNAANSSVKPAISAGVKTLSFMSPLLKNPQLNSTLKKSNP